MVSQRASELTLQPGERGTPAGDAARLVDRFFRRKPLGAVSAVFVLIFLFSAVFAPMLSPYDPQERHPAGSLASPTAINLLGTDQLGRDVLSRIILGARISLTVGLAAVVLGVSIGTLAGLAAGYWGGRVDLVLQRIVDTLMAFPGLILNLFIMAVLGAGLINVVIALAIGMAPNASRIVRGATVSVKQEVYIEAARALGASHKRIIFRYILPNVAAPIIVISTIGLGAAIIAEASLSFLGLGVPPPTPTWGQMIGGSSRLFIERAPWLALFPGIAISLTVMSINLFGDALRDILDPRLRQS